MIIISISLSGWHSFDSISLSLIHISEPTRRTPISYAVFCLKKNKSLIPYPLIGISSRFPI